MKSLTLPTIDNSDERILIFFGDDDAAIEKLEKEDQEIIDTWMSVMNSENFTALQVGEKNRFMILSDFNGQLRISYFSIEHGKLYANMHENYKTLKDAAEKLARYSNGKIILN